MICLSGNKYFGCLHAKPLKFTTAEKSATTATFWGCIDSMAKDKIVTGYSAAVPDHYCAAGTWLFHCHLSGIAYLLLRSIYCSIVFAADFYG